MVVSSSQSDVIQALSLLLSSNDRGSSFCWTRGSKHNFLASFSYFSSYFFILVFFCSCYFIGSLHLSWLHGDQISLSCFSYHEHSEVVCCTCATLFLAQVALFLLEQDFCGTLAVDSVPGWFPILTFTKGFWCKHLLDNRGWYFSCEQAEHKHQGWLARWAFRCGLLIGTRFWYSLGFCLGP